MNRKGKPEMRHALACLALAVHEFPDHTRRFPLYTLDGLDFLLSAGYVQDSQGRDLIEISVELVPSAGRQIVSLD
jgi:hypothetical protein